MFITHLSSVSASNCFRRRKRRTWTCALSTLPRLWYPELSSLPESTCDIHNSFDFETCDVEQAGLTIVSSACLSITCRYLSGVCTLRPLHVIKLASWWQAQNQSAQLQLTTGRKRETLVARRCPPLQRSCCTHDGDLEVAMRSQGLGGSDVQVCIVYRGAYLGGRSSCQSMPLRRIGIAEPHPLWVWITSC
jgi:hypothetical protein